MGIRAKLTKEDAAAGLDFLLVMGIKDSPDGTTDWTPRLAELFNAHHYTDGLSFVPQGTPSNNTADAPSGFSSNDPGHEASYLAERSRAGISTRRRIECRCADNRAWDWRTPVRFLPTFPMPRRKSSSTRDR